MSTSWLPHYKVCGELWKSFPFRINQPILSGSSPLTPSVMIQVQLMIVTGRSPEVKWDHNNFFANNSRQDRDRDVQMVPNELARQAASENMHINLLRSWPDLDLTWGQILKLTFQYQKVNVSNWLHELKMIVSFLSLCHSYEKSYQWKTISVKSDSFSFDDFWSQNCCRYVKSDQETFVWHEESYPMLFLKTS